MPHYKTKDANFRVFIDSRQGGRKYMEDVLMIREHKSEDGKNDFVFWGVFDGHGGAEAAKFARLHLLDELMKIKGFWTSDTEQVSRAIKEAFVNTHRLMWKNVSNWPKTLSGLPSTAGTTASIVFIKNGKIYVAHVGDSSVVIGWEKATWQRYLANLVTVDHKPEDPEEKKRIEASGGLVMAKAGVQRVVWHRPKPNHKGPVRRSTHIDNIPFLAVARALGDLWSYNSQRDTFVVSPEPDITVMDFEPKKHKCIILASDGLWNMVKPEQAVHLVESMDEAEAHAFSLSCNPARKLVSLALDRWAMRQMRADNTSVICALIDLPGVDPSPGAHTNDRLTSKSSSASTLMLSDSDSEGPPYNHIAPSPQHFGFGRTVGVKHAHVTKTPKYWSKVRHLKDHPRSAPPKCHSSTSSRYPSHSGASPVFTATKRKISSDSPGVLHPVNEPTAVANSSMKRKASEDSCPSVAKKMRQSSPTKSDNISISDISSEVDISSEDNDGSDVDLVLEFEAEEVVDHNSSAVAKADSPREATSAKSPVKTPPQEDSPSLAVTSPLWPGCLDKDIDLDSTPSAADGDNCALPPVSSSAVCNETVLRENSTKAIVTVSSALKKSAYAKFSKKLSGSQNQVARTSVLRRKSPSQGKSRVTVHRFKLRTIKLRNGVHRTRLQCKAVRVSSRRS